MKSSQTLKFFRVFLILVLGAFVFSALAGPGTALAGSTGFSEYYIPVEADQLWNIFEDNDNNPNLIEALGIHYVFAVTTSTDNTIVYYDHWEDGYDFDEITLTGADESFTANQGTVLEFETNDVPVRPRGTGMNVCTSTHPPGATATNFCYDGRDRIYVVGGIATVTLAVWPADQGTIYAFAWELFPTKPYQTDYTIPVGENLFGAPYLYDDFDNVYVLAQATADGTTVQIDDPQTGPGADIVANLNKGEVVDLWHIWAGTTVSANFPVQVQFIVGQVHTGGAETRGYTVVPSSLWSDEYYAPVDGSVGNGTDLYVYNPNASAITITWADSTGTGNFSLAAGATIAYTDPVGANHAIPPGSGVQLTGTGIFWGIGSVDTEALSYDWNFSLIPATALTTEYYVGWAPGTSAATPTNNCSPIWITAAQDNTNVQIDYGPTDGTFDFAAVVNQLDSLRVYDPDNDNSGMHIVASAPIAVAWGEASQNQSGASCSVASPNMDLGYTVLPQLEAFIDSVLNLEKTANPTVILDEAGQTTEFTIVASTANYPMNAVDVKDILPANWAYVPDTTTITFPDGSTLSGSAANPIIAGQTLTWDINVDMPPNATLTVVFTAITTGPPGGASVNPAEATGTYNGNTFSANDTALVDVAALKMNKVSSVVGTVYPGDTIQYTVVISNVGSVTQNDVVVTDTLPLGTTYVAQSTTVTDPLGTKDNIPGGINPDLVDGTLPNLVLAGDNYDLLAGTTMTVVFQVTVNDPITGGLTSIDNTVFVSSVEEPVPLKDSTTNPLPLANLGDRVWYDMNGNGLQDSGELGVSGVVVNLYDPGSDGATGGGDDVLVATTTTDANGIYAFNNIVADTYFVQVELPTGYTFTAQNTGVDDTIDSDVDGSGQTALVVLPDGATNITVDAGLVNSELDYGDLPASYNNTILGDDGARHIVGSLKIGASVDTEHDGQESGTAIGDDNDGNNDDDGVNRDMADIWTNGATIDIGIDLQGSTASGFADVGIWIDWNGDSVFGGPLEFIAFPNLPVPGAQTIQITIPDSGTYTVGNSVNVRVRAFDPASTPGGSLDSGDFLGLAFNGEVEDYQWAFSPTSITLVNLVARPASSVTVIWIVLGLLFALSGFALFRRSRKAQEAKAEIHTDGG